MIVLAAILLAGLCHAVEKQAGQDKKKILVVHSYHEGLIWTDGQNQGIKETFADHKNIELSIEYLDSKRIPLFDISGRFADFLSEKYKATSFDAIIVSDDNALVFLAGCHKKLFPGVPVVFCGINDFTPGILDRFDGLATGVVQTLDPGGTIDLIRKLQPDIHELAVVSGTTPTAVAIRDQVKSVLASRNDGLIVVWLDGLDSATLKERLASLSGNDAVLLCNFNRDANGIYYSHQESAVMISDVANAPVYAMEDHYLGTGVAGGYMNASKDQGCVAARLCLEILNTGIIPDVDMACPNRVMFDHRAMARFGLNRSHLPASAVIINQPESFYRQYRDLIQNVVLIFCLLLVAFMGATYWLVQSRRAERNLRTSEENLRTTLDSIGDAVITTDTKGRVVRMNPVAQQLTGWKMEDVAGRELSDIFNIVYSKTQERAESPVNQVLRRGEVVGLVNHTELIGKDGRRHQIADSAAPIKDDFGVITGVVLVFRDVTEDYQMRKALQESEKQYRLFAENSGDLIWTCKGRADNFAMTYINPAVESFLGYSVAEYLSLPREKRVAAESLRVMDAAVAEMEKGASKTIDIRHIHKDGHLVDCELWAKPLFDSNGDMTGFQGRTIDITERKRAELRLAEINACLVDLGADYEVNINALTALCGRLLRGTCAFYNRLQGGLLCSIGQWQPPPGYVSEDAPEGHLCNETIRRGRVEPFVVRNLSATDYARTDPNVVKYGLQTYVGYPALCAGELVGSLCVVYKDDLTPSGDDLRILGIVASALAAEEDRKRAGEELLRMQKLEELGTVAGGIAHDFNNLLTGIFGNMELARLELPEDSRAGSYLHKAYKTIGNARGLTGQLLTFAKGGAPILGTVNTGEIVHDTVDFNLHGSNIRAEFDLQQDLWPIEADKGQIGQVIANITVNARQAMPDGGTLHVKAVNIPRSGKADTTGMTGDFVQITIRDEGPGIPLNIIERIFDPYFTTKQEGHGLGLSVVNSIVEQHGGRIHVDSSTGVGSTFDVFLPALSDAKALGAAETAPEDEEHGGAAALHILLMDDDAMIRKIVDKLISHLGHTVETAADGDMALLKYSEARANGNSFDLVLMDLTIRGSRGGDDVVRQLLDIDPGARVIVASGYASNPVMANYMDYGFSGKLVKPYKLADLKREITRVVNETKPQ